MVYVREVVILLEDTTSDYKNEELTRITDVINTILTRDPKQISVPKMDAKGNKAGVQVIWLSNNLLEELNTCGAWPAVEVDGYEEKKVYFLARNSDF